MQKSDIAQDGKFYSLRFNDRGAIYTYISTLDGEKFSVLSVLAGEEGVLIAVDVSYQDADDCANKAIRAEKAKRAARILTTVPMQIIKLDHKWVLDYK